MSSTSTRAFYGASVAGPTATGGGEGAPMFDGIMGNAGDFISDLSALKAKGARTIFKFVGGPANYTGVNSEFSLAMWKARMDLAAAKTSAAQMHAFVRDGTLVANLMLDDMKAGGSVFPGGVPDFATLESMATHSQSYWSQVPTCVRVENQYLKGLAQTAGASNYSYLDFAWAQWHKRFGNPLTWFTNHVNDGRSVQLGAMSGINLLDGGSGITAPWNIHPNNGASFGMSPQEIDACGAAYSALTTLIGINVWAENPTFDAGDYWHYTSIQTALTNYANQAIGKAAGPFNWHASGSTSGSTKTISGNWTFLGYNRVRNNDAITTNAVIPSGVVPNAVLGLFCYSRESGRSAQNPNTSVWSEAKRFSGNSAQGGDGVLFYKIADGSEAGSTVAVPWSGTATGTATVVIAFAFSGNTQGQPNALAVAGSAKTWAGGTANMGPVPGLTSTRSDALILVFAAKTNDFANGDPVPDATMSATTSGGETWNRMTLTTNTAGDDCGILIDYAATSGIASITTKSWSQTSGTTANALGSGGGFMVAFAPLTVVAGQPPAMTALDDVTMSVSSLLSFTMVSTGSTPFTWSKTSGPSNVTVNSSTGMFNWAPQSAGTYVIDVKVVNSFGTDTDEFIATIVASGSTSTSGGGSGGGSGTANTAPTITHPGNKTVNAHDLLSFIISASDAQSDPMTFSLSNNPVGSFIDSNTGQFVWIPSGEQGPGTYGIVCVVSDGQAESRSTFTVTVNDTPWTRIGGPASQLGRTTPTNTFTRIL